MADGPPPGAGRSNQPRAVVAAAGLVGTAGAAVGVELALEHAMGALAAEAHRLEAGLNAAHRALLDDARERLEALEADLTARLEAAAEDAVGRIRFEAETAAERVSGLARDAEAPLRRGLDEAQDLAFRLRDDGHRLIADLRVEGSRATDLGHDLRAEAARGVAEVQRALETARAELHAHVADARERAEAPLAPRHGAPFRLEPSAAGDDDVDFG
jgi:hypothetical protein